MRKKKILHIMPRYTTGGAERLVLLYAKKLDKKKYKVRVASTNGGGELFAQFQQANIDAHVVDRHSLGGRRKAYHKLLEIAEEFEPDIIHSHLFGGDLLALTLKKKMPHVKWVSTVHNVRKQESWLRRKIWGVIFTQVNNIIGVAKEVTSFLYADYGFDAGTVQTIPNGVDLAPWLKLSDKSVLSESTVRLATIGRLEEQKGHTYLLKALGTLPKEVNWTLDVYGDGSLAEPLQKEAESLGIAKKITWHGVSDQLANAYKTIDVVVQPSLWEGMSLVMMEAMGTGRLVIASQPAAVNLVKNGETGIVVPEKDSAALAAAISDVHNKKRRMKRIAAAGRVYAKEHFSAEAHVAKIEAIYEQLS
ncbi:MAG: glycosyltransferase family 4 protein [Candidatus Magasanikbacteria bacterium]|jgi:L-malate glycosyltransferase|nr:glycosyltransferase family 4 protein [Candidatus Magasanikbacteria bacterium]